MFRRGTAVIGVVVTMMLVSGCTPTGDSFAASLAERVIIGIGDDITPPYPKPKDAERLAAEAIAHPRLPQLEAPVDYDIDVLRWEGHSGDADARLLAAVEGATFENVNERVQQQFADAFSTVTSAEHEGELIVALGIPSEEECVVAVRHADNAIEILRGWQKVLLHAGETGCDPDLYIRPTTTH